VATLRIPCAAETKGDQAVGAAAATNRRTASAIFSGSPPQGLPVEVLAQHRPGNSFAARPEAKRFLERLSDLLSVHRPVAPGAADERSSFEPCGELPTGQMTHGRRLGTGQSRADSQLLRLHASPFSSTVVRSCNVALTYLAQQRC